MFYTIRSNLDIVCWEVLNNKMTLFRLNNMLYNHLIRFLGCF